MTKIDPRAVWGFFFRGIFRSFFYIMFFGVWVVAFFSKTTTSDGFYYNSSSFLPTIIGVLFSYLILSFIWAKLTYYFYGYELTDIGIKKESGIITKKYVTIPYDRIQNVDINRGLISRILGISDILVQTAGSSAAIGKYGAFGVGAEGELFGLSKEVAEELRDELIRRSHKSRNQGV